HTRSDRDWSSDVCSSDLSATNNGSIRKLDPNLAAPYSINSAVTLEQSLKKGWRFTVSYDVTRGVHQIRTRNINAPYPGTPLSDRSEERRVGKECRSRGCG